MAMAISVSRRQWGTGPELLPARALAHRPVARHRVDARRFDPDARDSVSPAATRTAHAQSEGAGEEAAERTEATVSETFIKASIIEALDKADFEVSKQAAQAEKGVGDAQ